MKGNNRFKEMMFGWVLVFSLIFGTTCVPSFAETREYTDEQGVKYSYDTSTHTASVIRQDYSLSGAIVIPSTIEDNEKTYSVESIEGEAFQYCYGLTSVEIPPSVTSIGENAFRSCMKLESIIIPFGVTSIEKEVFHYCESLKSVTIPSSVTSIGESAFSGCKSLESITIPPDVTSIEKEVFHGCESLKSVTIPSGVASIGESAFSGCKSLESIAIPPDVTSIGENAFGYCESLESITIPSSVISLGEMVFAQCIGLKEIKVDSGNVNYSAKDGVLYNKDKTELICYPSGKSDKSFVVPESVTSIAMYAFWVCDYLEDISIPDNVETLGDYMLFDYSALKSLSIGAGVKEIPLGMCATCASLTSVTIPSSVTSVSIYAFYSCPELERVTIESGVKEICDYAFSYGKLTNVTLPESVVSLGEYAFIKDGGLSNIYVPSKQLITETHEGYIADIWCYEVKEGQSTTPGGKTLVRITSHLKGDSDFIMCNGMGTTYEIEEIGVDGVELKHENLQGSDTVYPTCTKSGHVPGYICKECGKHFVDEDGTIEICEGDWELPALGHDYGAVIYTWSEDNSTCTATVTCANDESHLETEEVNTTIGARSEAGCEEEGFINYIAIFTNPVFLAQTKLVRIPAIDHTWREPTYTWSNDKSLCIAMRVCENDESHVEIEVGNITTEVTTPATYTEPGAGTRTATFENPNFSQQTISIEIPATALLGDVNGDGSVNIKDYVKLYRYVQGLTTLTEEEKARADINKDGSINIKDYVKLYRYVQGLIETL